MGASRKGQAQVTQEQKIRQEQARQLREHLTRYGAEMTAEAREKHQARLVELERNGAA